MSGSQLAKKARTIFVVVLVVYAGTVATNLGEFWPFSIYPMFSQGGNTWYRSLAREYPPEDSVSWEIFDLQINDLDNVPGEPFSVRAFGVDPIDLANFVSKTEVWDDVRVAALRRMFFQDDPYAGQVVVYRVKGELTDDSEVLLEAMPYVVLSPEGDRVNPGVRP